MKDSNTCTVAYFTNYASSRQTNQTQLIGLTMKTKGMVEMRRKLKARE